LSFAATRAGGALTAAHVRERLGPTTGPIATPSGPRSFVPIGDEIRALEIQRMTQALEAAGGNQTRAAELIGMPLRTFFTKMRQQPSQVAPAPENFPAAKPPGNNR
jgi:two-component system, NtrC family, response regulator AtoC